MVKKTLGVLCRNGHVNLHAAGVGFRTGESLGGIQVELPQGKEQLLTKAGINDFMDRYGVGGAGVTVALTPDALFYRKLSLPLEAEEDLDQAIRLQVMNFLPGDPEDYYIQRSVMSTDEKLEVDLYMIAIDKVTRLTNFLRSAGISLRYLTLDALLFQQLLAQHKDLMKKAVFWVQLQHDGVALYFYLNGRFQAYQYVPVQEEDRNTAAVTAEIERMAGFSRLADDVEIEAFYNEADVSWRPAVTSGDPRLFRPMAQLLQLEKPLDGDLAPLMVALASGRHRKPPVNLIPSRWEGRTSRLGLIPTAISLTVFCWVLGLYLTREYYQQQSYCNLLDNRIARIKNDYDRVLKLKKSTTNIEKEFNAFQQVVHKPVSNIDILKEITEKAGPKTYLTEYIRDDQLYLSGFTDSTLELMVRLNAMRFVKSLNMEGSITTSRDNLQTFRYRLQFKEDKK